MFRIDDPSAVSTAPAVPAPTGSTPGFFTNGNPAAGQAATLVDDWWLNQQQEELLAIVAAAGIAPSKGQNNQVLLALQDLFGVEYIAQGQGGLILPRGLIIQTFATPGVTLGPANTAVSYTVTYPIAFPNRLIAIFARDNGSACISWGSFQNPGLASSQGWVWSSAAGNGNQAQGAVTAIGY